MNKWAPSYSCHCLFRLLQINYFVTSYYLVGCYQLSGGTCCLHLNYEISKLGKPQTICIDLFSSAEINAVVMVSVNKHTAFCTSPLLPSFAPKFESACPLNGLRHIFGYILFNNFASNLLWSVRQNNKTFLTLSSDKLELISMNIHFTEDTVCFSYKSNLWML